MIANHQHQRTVRFAETDVLGFAYFDTYIRMIEETEYSFLRSRGLRVVLDDGKGIIGFPRISATIKVENPLRFEELADITLQVRAADGKQIVYDFVITHQQTRVAGGAFKVACCRFPDGENPYAILIPDFVLSKLAGV